jgi:hypothetical protein
MKIFFRLFWFWRYGGRNHRKSRTPQPIEKKRKTHNRFGVAEKRKNKTELVCTGTSSRLCSRSRTLTVLLYVAHSILKKKIKWTVVYYKSIKSESKTRPIYECRCDERLKTKTEESTRLTYTVLFGELEHLKIETRLIDEMFVSVMGEYVFLKW